MPKGFGALGTVRGFMHIVKEVDFDDVRSRAETAPRILVAADDVARAEVLVASALGVHAMQHVDIRTEGHEAIDGTRYDVIVVVDPAGSGILNKVRQAAGDAAGAKVVFVRMSEPEMTGKEITSAQDAIVAVDAELVPALGRHFGELQLAAVKAIVDETSKANAQFALVSNAPAVVPFIGGIVAASADLIVLTKNQVMMVFKIAAVHNRDLNDQVGVLRELAPVVGGGFLWRTVARQAASFLPLAAGTVPKVMIAFVGTLVMGRAADYYYRFGKKPTREHLREFTKKASETASRLQISRNDDEAVVEAVEPDEERIDKAS
jgi:uncharacterized protein (DUF697 family)